jgi:hypothetical protein
MSVRAVALLGLLVASSDVRADNVCVDIDVVRDV